MGQIILIRHGETEWSAAHRHTSYTDLGLTPAGERQAAALAGRLAGRSFAAVHASPRRRARRTAELAGLADAVVDEDLAEWNYGRYEGMTGEEIRREAPDWYLWRDGCPDGESPERVGDRLDRVLQRAATHLASGDVALVGHGHSLRVAGARWVGLPAGDGGRFRLETGGICLLGYEHGRPVILQWNVPG